MNFNLIIDTSTDRCVVALIQNMEVMDYQYLQSTQIKTELTKIVDEILKKEGCTIDAIKQIACGVGPGYFTGIRLGLAFSKALALAKNIPLIGFSSLHGFISDKEGVFYSLIDAKSKGVYCLKQENKSQKIKSLSSPQLISKQHMDQLCEPFIDCVGPKFPLEQIQGQVKNPDPLYLSQLLFENPSQFEGPKTLYLSSPVEYESQDVF